MTTSLVPLPKSSLSNPTFPADVKVYSKDSPQNTQSRILPPDGSSATPNAIKPVPESPKVVGTNDTGTKIIDTGGKEISVSGLYRYSGESEASFQAREAALQKAVSLTVPFYQQREKESMARLNKGEITSYKSDLTGETYTKQVKQPVTINVSDITPQEQQTNIVSNQIETPSHILTAAPTLKQQYLNYIKDKPKISGTLSFFGEKVSGLFTQIEQKTTNRGQSAADVGLVSTAASTAPFLIPGIGGALFVGSVGETVFSKKGQEAFKQTVGGISETYGYPKPAVALVTYLGLGLPAVAEGKNIVGVLSKPYTISRTIPESIAYEKSITQPIIKGGESIERTGFNIKKYTEPTFEAQQTVIGKLTGQKPNIVQVASSRIDYVVGTMTTKEGKIVEGQFMTKRAGEGVTLRKVYDLTGSQVEIAVKDFSKLSSQEKQAANLIAGNKLVPSDSQFFRGSTEAKYILRRTGYDNGNVVFIKPTGKTITRETSFTILNKAPIQEKGFETFLSATGSKDITRLKSRGTTVMYGENIVMPSKSLDEVGTRFTRGSQKTTFDSGQKAIQTLKSVESTALKTLPKPKVSSTFSKPMSKILEIEEELPSIVGGSAKAESSSFYGKGEYELTSETAVPKSIDIVKPTLIESTNTSQKQEQPQKTKSELNLSGGSINIVSPMLTPKITENIKPREEQTTKLGLRLDTKEEQISLNKLITIQKNPIQIRPPTPSYKYSNKNNNISLAKIKSILKSSKAFDVLVKRKGKFVTVGEKLPIGLATKKGAEVVERTLAASFKLKPSGETNLQDISYTPSAKIFRPSKKEAGVLVQRKGGKEGGLGRLASGTERLEIKQAKRSKKLWK